METTDYVSYPVALALKKAGFDWKCDHCYAKTNEDEHEFIKMTTSRDYNKPRAGEPPSLSPICSAVPLWQAQKWLREKGVAVSVQAREIQGELWYSADIITTKGINELVDGGFDYMVYEAAISAGISAALELITQ